MPPPYPWLRLHESQYPSYFTPTYPIGITNPRKIPTPMLKNEPQVGDTVRITPKPREVVIHAIDDEFITEKTGEYSLRYYSRTDCNFVVIKSGLGDPKDDLINTIRERLGGGPGVWLKAGINIWTNLGGSATHTYTNHEVRAMMQGGAYVPAVGKVIGILSKRVDT